MSDLTFADAAVLPDPLPETDGFGFYIGGDAVHVYTATEVEKLKASYKYLLPIFVRSDPPGPGAAADVSAAVTQLKALGVPAWTLVAWDVETAVDLAYIADVTAGMATHSYFVMPYGSISTVLAYVTSFIWGADWTGTAHMASGCVMTQYAPGKAADSSVANPNLPFWEPSAPPSPAQIEDDMTPALAEMDGTHLFSVGTDKECYYLLPDGTKQSLGGEFTSGLAATASADGVITVAGAGTDHFVYVNVRSSSGSWSGWRNTGLPSA